MSSLTVAYRRATPRLRVVVAFLLILLPIIFANVTLTPAPAKAVVSLCIDGGDRYGTGPGYPTGLDALLEADGAKGPVTPAELYGSRLPTTSFTGEAGALESQCGFLEQALNPGQNLMYSVSQGLGSFVIGMYRWASDPSVLSAFFDPIDCLVGGRDTGAQNCTVDGLSNTLFGEFLIVVVVLASLYLGYRALVKKRTSEAVQGVVWMVACVALFLVFSSQPSWFAKQANNLVATASEVMLGATTSLVAGSSSELDMCDLPSGGEDSVATYREHTRESSCYLWKVLIYEPWKASQFPGMQGRVPIEDEATRTYVMAKFPHLGETANDITFAQLDSTLVDSNEYRGEGGYSPDQDQERFEAVVQQAAQQPWAPGWAGRDTGGRFLTAIMALFASLFGGLLILIFAFASLVYNVMLLLLIAIAPVVALLGVFPGTRRIAMKWVETFIGTVVKRLILVVILSLLLGFYTIIAALNINWFAKLIFIAVFGVGAFLLRKPFSQALKSGQPDAAERYENKASSATVAGASTLISGRLLSAALSASSRAFRNPTGVRNSAAEGRRVGRANGNTDQESGQSPRPTHGPNEQQPQPASASTASPATSPQRPESAPAGPPNSGRVDSRTPSGGGYIVDADGNPQARVVPGTRRTSWETTDAEPGRSPRPAGARPAQSTTPSNPFFDQSGSDGPVRSGPGLEQMPDGSVREMGPASGSKAVDVSAPAGGLPVAPPNSKN